MFIPWCFLAWLVAVEGGAAPEFERGALDDDRVSRIKDCFMEMPPLTSPLFVSLHLFVFIMVVHTHSHSMPL